MADRDSSFLAGDGTGASGPVSAHATGVSAAPCDGAATGCPATTVYFASTGVATRGAALTVGPKGLGGPLTPTPEPTLVAAEAHDGGATTGPTTRRRRRVDGAQPTTFEGGPVAHAGPQGRRVRCAGGVLTLPAVCRLTSITVAPGRPRRGDLGPPPITRVSTAPEVSDEGERLRGCGSVITGRSWPRRLTAVPFMTECPTLP